MPNNKGDVTTLLPAIWDVFTDKQKKVFGGQKDSWNTADVFVVNTMMEKKDFKRSRIKRYIR